MAEEIPVSEIAKAPRRRLGLPRVRMTGITKRFGSVLANDSVDLEVRSGEIHGLLGENGAGKTTLMNVLFGLVEPDSGSIEIEGAPARIRNPRDALALGIGMVHQHYMLVPNMTVAENVALGLPADNRWGLLRLSRVAQRVSRLSREYGLGVDPDARIDELSVVARQRVEILKLLYRDARVLILDEPTAVLTPTEWEGLGRVIRSLAAAGRGVIFITHKLGELLSIADVCTVLRDGKVVGSVDVSSTDEWALARMMVGRDVVLRVEREPVDPGPPVLEVRGLSCAGEGGRRRLDGITFEVRAGEILGVAGVDGNGQRELVETLVGVRSFDGGELVIRGESVSSHGPREFVRRSGAVITEDRQSTGAILNLALLDNLTMKEFREEPFSRLGVLTVRVMRQHGERLVREYDIRTPGLSVPLRSLSGGNQQKVVLARELYRAPRLLVAAQPTRGLDVGATEFVYRQLMLHRKSGTAILLISSDLEEIRSLSDRIAVMVDGRFIDILDADEATTERLGLLMGGSRGPRS
jgi:ABC-type uncharacterized transport system ATPase subunit